MLIFLLLENRSLYTILTQFVFPRENGNSNWKRAHRGIILLLVKVVWPGLISALVCKSGRPNYYSSIVVLKAYWAHHTITRCPRFICGIQINGTCCDSTAYINKVQTAVVKNSIISGEWNTCSQHCGNGRPLALWLFFYYKVIHTSYSVDQIHVFPNIQSYRAPQTTSFGLLKAINKHSLLRTIQ
jgi:hypothetical protein